MATIPYTTRASVERLLRVANNTVKIGDEETDQLSYDHLDEYILDASRIIDMTIAKVCLFSQVPLADYTLYPEVALIAPRAAAFLIFRDLHGTQRFENVPMGPRGWIQDAKDYLKQFIDNINSGVYETLSPSTDGPGWETAMKFFQNEIGVPSVHDTIANRSNLSPMTSENIGPYTED